ncbi:tRNA (cytidine(34)-2'-O)-methyltransferase [Bdellovibrionota bacterium FG-2]
MEFDFHVVLVEPEIPQNTGSIGRLCLATGCTLHLIEPLGFEITHARLRRAGLDYWEHLKVQRHPGLKEFLESISPNAPKVFLSKKSGKTLYEHKFEPGTYFFFGKETMGLPEWVIGQYPLDTFRIPMFDARVRSLNLSNTVSIAVYEAIRQLSIS